MNLRLLKSMLWSMALLCMASACAQAAPLPPAGCSECHTNASHRLFSVKSDSSCASCHSKVEPEHALLPVAHTTKTAASAKSGASEATKKKLSKPPVTADPNPMVLIPAGKFIMGYNDRMPDEGPQHTVYLPDYYIDVYEVTNAQYKKFIDATKRRSPSHFRNRTYPEGTANHPVTQVNWYDAVAYCKWAGKRLPTDAEWEKAGRGPNGRLYPWGDTFYADNANTPQRWEELGQPGHTMPVGSFPQGVSPYGLYDMSGNVWEWTSSWYEAYPGNKHPSENYGEQYKTLKGGSWFDCSFYKCGISAPLFNRSFFLRTTHNDSFGFRCAKDAGSDDRHHAGL